MPESLRVLRDLLSSLSSVEIHAVAWLSRPTRYRPVAAAAAAISWLGNGYLYALLGIPILLLVPGSLLPVLVSTGAMLIAHLLYPWLKLACARERPFTLRGDLPPLIKTLDKLSFPSGHVMSLTAFSTPILMAFPVYLTAAGGLWLAMCWSRIACVHHYPSDVLAGTALGATIAMPLSWSILGL